MSVSGALVSIVRVGFLNRVRRYSFLVTLVLCIVAGYVFVPAPGANYVTLGWGSDAVFYRGVYNSAWIGSMVALLTGMFLALFGFYVVNDVVRLDEDSGVGQVIATAPLGNPVYTLGCAVSNFLVLVCMVFIVFLTALGMQFIRGEVFTVDLWALFSPFLVIVVPLMFLVASVAVFFETTLSRSVGNIVYVFLWLFGVPILSDSFDLFGNYMIISSMRAAGEAVFPGLRQNQFILGYAWGFPEGRELAAFAWTGVQWSLEVIQARLFIVVLAVVVSLLASLRFHRFDPSGVSRGDVVESMEPVEVPEVGVTSMGEVRLEALEGEISFGFGSMLLAELRLMLREFPSIGGMGILLAIGLFAGGIFLPVDLARGVLLPMAWLVPVLYWSRLGSREARFGTGQLVFSSAFFVLRQYLALWLVGFLISLATGGGVMLRLMLSGEVVGACAVFIGALFVPSLAVCLGVWTGSCKVFEFLYVLLWYVGPISGAVGLDFMGALPGSVAGGVWWFYLGAAIVLFGLGFMGRLRQLDL